MNRKQLVSRARSLTRDLSNSVFREVDVVEYINEGIDRLQQVVPEFREMSYLDDELSVPTHLPNAYHSLLALYSASRLFFQDERHYQATTLMNEFETKLEEMYRKIQIGDIVVKDASGNVVDLENTVDYVVDNYFDSYAKKDAFDLVEGVDVVEETVVEWRDKEVKYWDDLK